MEYQDNKNPMEFNCEKCQYITAFKKDFEKHILTQKHKFRTNGIQKSYLNEEPVIKNQCSLCKKIYSCASNLCKHKKKCSTQTQISREPLSIELVLNLIHQNKELQDSLSEAHTKIVELANNTKQPTTTNNNTNNTQFNLQFFLNETCKDAMNLTDFINSLQVSTLDFENTGKVGYIEGITQIIINGLNQVDTTKRPVHCTDVKRETLYIKHKDSWEKENPDKENLKKAVKLVARINLSQLPKWQRENPASEVLDTKENDQYIKYSLAALGGKSEEEEDKFVNKIMKNVLKEIILSKKL